MVDCVGVIFGETVSNNIFAFLLIFLNCTLSFNGLFILFEIEVTKESDLVYGRESFNRELNIYYYTIKLI